jgi:hypothetical protein
MEYSDTKQTRVVKKTVPTESFFNFFSPPKAPTDEDDDDAASDIEERLELDYQLGEDIKEKLIPRAIDWFTGEALQFEELDEEMEEGDFEDEVSFQSSSGRIGRVTDKYHSRMMKKMTSPKTTTRKNPMMM